MTVFDALLAVPPDVDPRSRDERLAALQTIPDQTVLGRDAGELPETEWEGLLFYFFPDAGFGREDIRAAVSLLIEERKVMQPAVHSAPGATQPTTRDSAHEPLAMVLDDVEAYIKRFVRFPDPDHQLAAIVLWVAHTWAMDAAETTPYLAVTAPEKGSGKSRLLEVLECLVYEPLFTANISVPALFRLIEERSPTLLLDEYDALLGGNQDRAQELRGVLNAGWRRKGGEVHRVELSGKATPIKAFRVFCAKALAGIGLSTMPDTVRDRSIIIRLQRQKQNDRAEKFRRYQAAEAEPIRSALAIWMESLTDQLATALPDLPEDLPDRAADGWEPLIAIADIAGEEWPDRARAAALALSGGGNPETDSLRVRLLADIRDVFLEPRLFTRDLLHRLHAIEDALWSDMRGMPLTGRALADLLRDHGIGPKDLRIGDDHGKGYVQAHFTDAFERYLPPVPNGDNGDNPNTA